MMRSTLVAITFATVFSSIAHAQTPQAQVPQAQAPQAQAPQAQAPAAASSELLADKDVPSSVTSRLRCSKPSGPVTVRAFAGGFVFTQPCPSGADVPDRLVFATDKQGAGARLLQFVRPEGRRISALGNVTFTQADTEIGGTIGRLSRRICRAEGSWRMEGKIPQPALVFWRQTRDCDGKTGWQTMVNRKR